MAITASQVNELRQLTGVGMMDCKKALVETDGDMQKAIELLRQKGQKMAAKRADRDANEGCVLAKTTGNFGAIIMVSCETDFVATNAGFVEFTTSILDAAMAKHLTTKEQVMDMDLNGSKVADAITDQIAKIGEKIELAHFETIEAEKVYSYIHPGNRMASIVGLNKAGYDQVGHDIAMQVVAMRPVALDAESVPQEIKDQEFRVAVEKTKEELIGKAVDAALKKAGINPAHVDSEEHMASNMGKGWITEEQVNQAREIKEKVAAEKAAQLSEQQINQIANGRLNKYFQENTLMEQEYIMEQNEARPAMLDALFLRPTDALSLLAIDGGHCGSGNVLVNVFHHHGDIAREYLGLLVVSQRAALDSGLEALLGKGNLVRCNGAVVVELAGHRHGHAVHLGHRDGDSLSAGIGERDIVTLIAIVILLAVEGVGDDKIAVVCTHGGSGIGAGLGRRSLVVVIVLAGHHGPHGCHKQQHGHQFERFFHVYSMFILMLLLHS